MLVNGQEYQTDLAYESDVLAQENAAMRAFMVCRNFAVNGGMLARDGIVQGLPATETKRRHTEEQPRLSEQNLQKHSAASDNESRASRRMPSRPPSQASSYGSFDSGLSHPPGHRKGSKLVGLSFSQLAPGELPDSNVTT